MSAEVLGGELKALIRRYRNSHRLGVDETDKDLVARIARVREQQLIARIAARAAALPNFELCGNAYRGVGIPDCIHGGQQAAERLLAACD